MSKDNNIYETKSGFKVPQGYWDTLEDSTYIQLKSKSVEKRTGFTVPKDYFKDFKPEHPTHEETIKVIPLATWSRWIAAASIIALAVLGALYIDSISPSRNIQFSDLDNEVIEDYLENHLETPDEFIDYNKTSIKALINQNIISLQSQEIINYLDDKLDEQDYNNDQ